MVKQEAHNGPRVILPESPPASTCLSFLVKHAVENKLALAAWRLPQDNTIHLILSNQPIKQSRDITIEELPAGYLVAPFDTSSDRLFLPADYHFTFVNDTLAKPASLQDEASMIWLQEKLRQVNKIETQSTPYYPASAVARQIDNYKEVVAAGVLAIEQGLLEKVVPSRTKSVPLPDGFDVVQTYLKLCQRYPHAMVSFASTPETGTWLGASPEVLVSLENNQVFKTVALAGTQPYQEGLNLKQVAWTQKEIEEQALVERYIISCFKKIRVREYEEHGPKTFIAGNLMHLKSDFTVDMKAINFPQLGSVMLQLLHPTSAVCGMPLEPALQFLALHEPHTRDLYAGYLGPVNINQKTSLFVNLRCMQLHDTTATLYAGAGVTIDSQPEAEWQETEIKMNTLHAILQG